MSIPSLLNYPDDLLGQISAASCAGNTAHYYSIALLYHPLFDVAITIYRNLSKLSLLLF